MRTREIITEQQGVAEEIQGYHGGPEGIDRFRPLTHFGSERAARSRMAKKKIDGRVYQVKLDIKNPAVIKDFPGVHAPTQLAFALKDAGIIDHDEMMTVTRLAGKPEQQTPILVRLLQSKGHDGIAYKNRYEDPGHVSYVILDGGQAHVVRDTAKTNSTLNERTVKQDIHDYLTKKRGYQFVSHGSVKTAYRDPKTGWVFLIAPDEGPAGAQRSFQEWAKFCAANKGNPNLPDFKELRPVEFEGQRYIATFVEPLRKPTSEQARWQAVAVTDMLRSADNGEDAHNAWLSTLRGLNAIDPRLGKRLPAIAPEVPKRDEQDVLKIVGGREHWQELWNLATRVVAQGKKLGFTIDWFTPGNVLQDQQGNIVISDPWAEFG